MNNPEQGLINSPSALHLAAEALFREQVRQAKEMHEFLESPIGDSMQTKIVNTWLSGILEFEKLTDEDVMDKPARVLELKRRMELARSAVYWIATIINDGVSGEHNLRVNDEAQRGVEPNAEGES